MQTMVVPHASSDGLVQSTACVEVILIVDFGIDIFYLLNNVGSTRNGDEDKWHSIFLQAWWP